MTAWFRLTKSHSDGDDALQSLLNPTSQQINTVLLGITSTQAEIELMVKKQMEE